MRAPLGPLVVVGDALLDVDVLGSSSRLCPDAPAPVVDVDREAPRPGGAGLAATMLARDLGPAGEVVLVAAVADDAEAGRLADLLATHGVRLVGVPVEGRTPVKRRVRVEGQSLLRLDSGGAGRPQDVPDEALAAVASARGVLVADYGRGTASAPALREALAEAARRVPVVWDPHPRGERPVPGVRLVTPNRSEAQGFATAAGLLEEAATGRGGADALAGVSSWAAGLVRHWEAHGVAVTMGAAGALLSHGESSPSVVPAPPVRAEDPCGAGDRFASAALRALASGAVASEAVQAAVVAASDFVAAGGAAGFAEAAAGPAPGTGLDRVAGVRAAGGTVVATGGCFDLVHAGHVATLEAARALGDCLVVCLNSDDSVSRLKGPSRPLVTQADRARVLDALECVDAVVVFDEDTPVQALERLRPDVWVKGGDYAGTELPEAAVLRQWGGQAVVLPYLEGRSTTRLVTAAAAGR